MLDAASESCGAFLSCSHPIKNIYDPSLLFLLDCGLRFFPARRSHWYSRDWEKLNETCRGSTWRYFCCSWPVLLWQSWAEFLKMGNCWKFNFLTDLLTCPENTERPSNVPPNVPIFSTECNSYQPAPERRKPASLKNERSFYFTLRTNTLVKRFIYFLFNLINLRVNIYFCEFRLIWRI